MWPDWVSNPGPLALESDTQPTGLCGQAYKNLLLNEEQILLFKNRPTFKRPASCRVENKLQGKFGACKKLVENMKVYPLHIGGLFHYMFVI